MTKMRWTQGEGLGRTTGEMEFRKAVITSPPSDTIWLNTCSRITFTWWMGWSEWRLDMDYQLILTANWEKNCTAYFVVEDLFWTRVKFSALLWCASFISGRFYFWLFCARVGNNASDIWIPGNSCNRPACFSIAAFNSYLSGSGSQIFNVTHLWNKSQMFANSGRVIAHFYQLPIICRLLGLNGHPWLSPLLLIMRNGINIDWWAFIVEWLIVLKLLCEDIINCLFPLSGMKWRLSYPFFLLFPHRLVFLFTFHYILHIFPSAWNVQFSTVNIQKWLEREFKS